MGRPRRHGSHTAESLLDAAERIVETDGIEALTVRRVAEEVGTTTRAVYTVFGSKDGLVIALGERAFGLLLAGIDALPETDDPAADLVEAGIVVFRRFAVEHPALFTIGVQQALPDPAVAAEFRAAAYEALAGLTRRVERLDAAGLLGGRTVHEAVWSFHALCEGLAALELRFSRVVEDAERLWRDALSALVSGFAAGRAERPRRGERDPSPSDRR